MHPHTSASADSSADVGMDTMVVVVVDTMVDVVVDTMVEHHVAAGDLDSLYRIFSYKSIIVV